MPTALSLRERSQRDGLVIGTRCAEPDAVDAVFPQVRPVAGIEGDTSAAGEGRKASSATFPV